MELSIAQPQIAKRGRRRRLDTLIKTCPIVSILINSATNSSGAVAATTCEVPEKLPNSTTFPKRKKTLKRRNFFRNHRKGVRKICIERRIKDK